MRLREAVRSFKREIRTFQFVLQDPRTPRLSRFFLGLAVAYVLSPIDLIPDFIPFLGQLDDAVIVPLLIWLALRLLPPELIKDCREKASQG